MRYLTAGESHGPRLTAIIEGIPAGLPLTAEDINEDLRRRQGGYGRGGRMKIESDQVVFTSGVRHGKTTGAPITMDVINKDHQKWLDIMSAEDIEDRLKSKRKITHPRPGHADLVGGIKYRFDDLRNSLERSSARETTMRVAVGAVAKRLLAELDMEIANHVVVFGGKEIDVPENLTVAEIKQRAAQSEVSIVNQEREQEIKDYIDQIKRDGDTIGGVVETVVGGVPVGLGMPAGITQSITEMCQKFGLPVDYENWEVDKLYQALTHDKKARGNTLKLVLVPELGSATIHPVSLEEMKDYLVK
ncbi:chorismate synthase%2C (5-enolpyruvylshikimate-3-phosphate phospholyase) [Streptococcus pneumoniae]|nr:chorismate synthase%2C (5-enolpyruvylshikimate-3-phosphate phospholyase) [Streptococcus pneumoniae]